MEQDLKKFLEALSRDNNAPIMESVLKGYSCIFEGYADVRDVDAIDATTQFNRRAAYNASMDGNNILAFLQQSSERLAPKYSVDDEPELDGLPTSFLSQPTSYEPTSNLDDQVDASEYNMTPQDFENNLGLTAQDMKDLF